MSNQRTSELWCPSRYTFSQIPAQLDVAVAYLRLRDDSDRVYCTFLMGKARPAPIKSVTMPRLELTAATISIRVGELLRREIDGDLDVQKVEFDRPGERSPQ